MSKQNIVVIDTGTGQEVENTDVRIEGTEGTLHMTEQGSAPANPDTDGWGLYFKSDGLYFIDDAGTETGPLIDATGAVTDHGALTGLADDDHTQYLLADGTRALTADWDAGANEIRAETFQSDVATGTAPLTVASTTVVTNLNADQVDGRDEDEFALLAGRSGGQTINGGTGAGENLVLDSTANASKGVISVPDSTVVLEASTPLRIIDNGGSAFAQFSILGGTDLRVIGGAGLTDFNASSLSTSVLTLDSDGAITATTGDITATAGDIVATAGDVLVTAGGVGIGSGAPSAKLHVDEGGTTPTISAATLAIFQNTTASSSSAAISIIGGAGTNGFSVINLGTSGDENSAIIRGNNGNQTIEMRAGGGGIDWTMDGSGNVTQTGGMDMEGTLQVGNASNRRWASVPIHTAIATSATRNLNATQSFWQIGTSTAGDLWFPVPSSIIGTEIKAVRVYYTTSNYSVPGSTINVGLYESSGGTNALVTGASASQAITSNTSTTLTATATGVQALAAGEQVMARVWISPSAGTVTFQITGLEVQYEEREY